MNGKLDVVSQFGSGSTFFFELVLPVKSKEDIAQDGMTSKLAGADDLSNIAVFRKAV